MNNNLKPVIHYLKGKRGFDFFGYHPSMIKCRVSQRLFATSCKIHPEYLRHFKKHSKRLNHLVDVLTINVALEEISKMKGVLYDPNVVNACLKLFSENDFCFKKTGVNKPTGDQFYVF